MIYITYAWYVSRLNRSTPEEPRELTSVVALSCDHPANCSRDEPWETTAIEPVSLSHQGRGMMFRFQLGRWLGEDIPSMRQAVFPAICLSTSMPVDASAFMCFLFFFNCILLQLFLGQLGHKLVDSRPETPSSTSTVPTNSLSSTASLVGVPWNTLEHREFPLASGETMETCNKGLLRWSSLVVTVRWPVWRMY